jgi:hypothetical protein
MKWYTCIVYCPNHISRVQYVSTRANSPERACLFAQKWFREPTHFKQPEVVYIFAGRLEPEIVDSIELARIRLAPSAPMAESGADGKGEK